MDYVTKGVIQDGKETTVMNIAMKTCLGKDVAVLVDTVLVLSNAITSMEPV